MTNVKHIKRQRYYQIDVENIHKNNPNPKTKTYQGEDYETAMLQAEFDCIMNDVVKMTIINEGWYTKCVKDE